MQVQCICGHVSKGRTIAGLRLTVELHRVVSHQGNKVIVEERS